MKHKPYRVLLFILLKIVHIIVLILPYKISARLGAFCGSLAFRFANRYNSLTVQNLKAVFSPQFDDKRIRKIAKGCFRNIGMTAAEVLSLNKLSPKDVLRLVRETDFSLIEEALSQGRGCIVIGSHFGNWEMASVFGAARGHKVTVVAKRIYYHRYNRLLVSLRDAHKVKTLYRDEPDVLRKCLRVLKSNGILGIVPDQDVSSVDGVFVDFFGRPAYTPKGPIAIAMLSGTPVVQSFMVREPAGLHLYIEGPLRIEKSGNKDGDILQYTKTWTQVLERYIRRYPTHWVWMHKRWKTRPEERQDTS